MTTVSAVSYPIYFRVLDTSVFVYTAVRGLSVYAGALSAACQSLRERGVAHHLQVKDGIGSAQECQGQIKETLGRIGAKMLKADQAETLRCQSS